MKSLNTSSLFFVLSEANCNALEGALTQLQNRILWNLVKREACSHSEVEKLRERVIILQNSLEEKEALLREKDAIIAKMNQ